MISIAKTCCCIISTLVVANLSSCQSLTEDLITEYVSDQLLSLDDEELAQVVNESKKLDGNFGVFINTPAKSESKYKRCDKFKCI